MYYIKLQSSPAGGDAEHAQHHNYIIISFSQVTMGQYWLDKTKP